MAPKKTAAQAPASKATNGSAAQAKAPAAAQANAQAGAPAKTPPQTDVKAILAISDRKLTREEAAILRKARLKKDGTAMTQHTGPRAQAVVTLVSVRNAIDTFGVESLAKLKSKYGKDLRKPLHQYIGTLTDPADKSAMQTLADSMFPVSRTGGFNSKPDLGVTDQGRAFVDVRPIGAFQGARVSKGEVVTLADGRTGLFVVLITAAPAPVAAQEAAAAPSASQPDAPAADASAFG